MQTTEQGGAGSVKNSQQLVAAQTAYLRRMLDSVWLIGNLRSGIQRFFYEKWLADGNAWWSVNTGHKNWTGRETNSLFL